ncbi:hypothetical protein FHETE_1376 [Fusarium heterosporum]|uniref:Uncharacterized protein n=1 Tax=Fusarium heterosporum TaxID=42747 RepID=A0A8H5TVW8_FUSHE|nr:hypothetical protein FHETE_1376 [Fusarium heterosporum]
MFPFLRCRPEIQLQICVHLDLCSHMVIALSNDKLTKTLYNAAWKRGINEIKNIRLKPRCSILHVLDLMKESLESDLASPEPSPISANRMSGDVEAMFKFGSALVEYPRMTPQMERRPDEEQQYFEIWQCFAPRLRKHHDSLPYLLDAAKHGRGNLYTALELAAKGGVSVKDIQHRFHVSPIHLVDFDIPELRSKVNKILDIKIRRKVKVQPLANAMCGILEDVYLHLEPNQDKRLKMLTYLSQPWRTHDHDTALSLIEKEFGRRLEVVANKGYKDTKLVIIFGKAVELVTAYLALEKRQEESGKALGLSKAEVRQRIQRLYCLAFGFLGLRQTEELQSMEEQNHKIQVHASRLVESWQSAELEYHSLLLPQISESLLRHCHDVCESPFDCCTEICKFVLNRTGISAADFKKSRIELEQAKVFGQRLARVLGDRPAPTLPKNREDIIKAELNLEDKDWLSIAFQAWQTLEYLHDHHLSRTRNYVAGEDLVETSLPAMELLHAYVFICLGKGQLDRFGGSPEQSLEQTLSTSRWRAAPLSMENNTLRSAWYSRSTRSIMWHSKICKKSGGQLLPIDK